MQDESYDFLGLLTQNKDLADLDIINGQSASRKKFLQIQIRINSFLDNLIDTMGTKLFPNPVVPFFN